MEFNNTSFTDPHDQPIVWLNDGTGHFSTLTVGDFVAPGQESRLGRALRLVPTRNGYSFFSVVVKETIPLTISALVATKPYR